MWAVRILNGPQAGKIFQLKPGKNILGRGRECDIQVLSMGASKEHCEISVLPNKVVISDLGSRNGTMLNGVKIQRGLLKPGDKASIHDVILEIIPADAQASVRPRISYQNASVPQSGGAAAAINIQESLPPPMAVEVPSYMSSEGLVKGLVLQVSDYIERVALPGVYRLPEMAEFKWVLAGFIGFLIVLVTVLCMLPAMQIGKVSIINESKRRAASLAHSLALLNQTSLLQGNMNAVSTHSFESEDGVKQAFIIQQVDGMILAPATQQGKIPDLSFVHTARLENKPQVELIDGNLIGASFPIGVFDPNTGEPSVKYHAIVIYDVGTLAFDDGRAISLFMQTLILASLAGVLVFYFMYKMVEFPIVDLNAQLDSALREKKDNLRAGYQYPALQNLVGNINSLLTRYLHGEGGGGVVTPGPATADEAAKVVNVIYDAALVVRADGQIILANLAFEQLLHAEPGRLNQQNITQIEDNSLQQNLEFLMNRSKENSFMAHSDQLEFGGVAYLLNCQAFGQPVEYFVITVSSGGAA
jgi:PAS domain-containing protein